MHPQPLLYCLFQSRVNDVNVYGVVDFETKVVRCCHFCYRNEPEWDGTELKPDVKARLTKKTREMGLWMLDVPEERGGIGLTLDPPLAKWFVDQRSRPITEGASEVMRMVIARHILQKYA